MKGGIHNHGLLEQAALVKGGVHNHGLLEQAALVKGGYTIMVS